MVWSFKNLSIQEIQPMKRMVFTGWIPIQKKPPNTCRIDARDALIDK